MARALVRICFKGSEQKRHNLTEKRTVVGREKKKCGIVVDNQSVSGQHFELINHGPLHWVRDLGSANGTFVNGTRVDTRCLRHLDEIVVGKYTLVYENAAATGTDIENRALPGSELGLDGEKGERKSSRSTYVMDQGAVEAYVKKMAGSGRTADGGPASSGARKRRQKDDRAARARSEVQGLKRMLILLGVVVVALAVVIGYLLYTQVG